MATIVIKDLPENMDLDRQAMQAITGGARWRGRPGAPLRTPARELRAQAPTPKPRAVMSTLFK